MRLNCHTGKGLRGLAAYTLAEVTVGVLVVGILFVSLYAGFSYGFTAMQLTRENLRATQILVQRMEGVRLYTWSQVLNTNSYLKPTFLEYYDPRGITNSTGGARYTGFVSATIPTDLPPAYQTNVRDITVTIFWTNYHGGMAATHSPVMGTRVSRNGMQNYVFNGAPPP